MLLVSYDNPLGFLAAFGSNNLDWADLRRFAVLDYVLFPDAVHLASFSGGGFLPVVPDRRAAPPGVRHPGGVAL